MFNSFCDQYPQRNTLKDKSDWTCKLFYISQKYSMKANIMKTQISEVIKGHKRSSKNFIIILFYIY